MANNSKIISIFLLTLGVVSLAAAAPVRAQTPVAFAEGVPVDVHTAVDAAAGKVIWEKFDAKTLGCKDLSNEEFRLLGEYYMDKMVGENHAALNGLIMQMIGESGEGAMHTAMGKRLSGCDPTAPYPAYSTPFLNMMQFPMTLGYSLGNPSCWSGAGNFLASYWWLAVIALIVWILAILGIAYIVHILRRRNR